MNNQELLKMAAKAAGVDCSRINPDQRENGPNLWIEPWNPIDDDGDALRLAVKLRLQPRQGVNLVSVLRPDGGWNDENYRDHSNDIYAATRQAIVRAAAEVWQCSQ